MPRVLTGFALCALLGCVRQVENLPDPPAPAARETDFVVSPDVFAKEAHTDPAAFRAKYHNKVVEVTGTVCFLRLYDGAGFLHGYKENEKDPLGKLVCFAPLEQHRDQLWALSQGQEVTVRGTQTDAGYPVLDRCEFVKVKPSTAIPVTVASLTAEFNADSRAAQKKYFNKSVVVRVKVLATRTEGNTFKTVKWTVTDPDAKGDTTIEVIADAATRAEFLKRLEQIRVGDVIVLLGEANGHCLADVAVLKEPPAGVKLPGDTK